MNQRLNKVIDWARWHEMFDRERPVMNEIVKLLMLDKKVMLAVYNPKWEHGFRVYGKNESVPSKPIAWRHSACPYAIAEGKVVNVTSEQPELVDG